MSPTVPGGAHHVKKLEELVAFFCGVADVIADLCLLSL